MKAVCIKCGEFKESAWGKCTFCDYLPMSEEEKAQLLLLSSHFNNKKKLITYSSHIKSGQKIDFKKEDLAVVTVILKQHHTGKKEQRKYIIKLSICFLSTVIFMILFYHYQLSKN